MYFTALLRISTEGTTDSTLANCMSHIVSLRFHPHQKTLWCSVKTCRNPQFRLFRSFGKCDLKIFRRFSANFSTVFVAEKGSLWINSWFLYHTAHAVHGLAMVLTCWEQIKLSAVVGWILLGVPSCREVEIWPQKNCLFCLLSTLVRFYHVTRRGFL